MKTWICRMWGCGHTVVAKEKPNPMKWADGHVCYFVEVQEEVVEEEEITIIDERKVCDNCGSFAFLHEDIIHHETCKPGESKRWEKQYNEQED